MLHYSLTHSTRTYHHLGDHRARIIIELIELRVLGLDLGRVNLWVSDNDTAPPLHGIDLLQLDQECAIVDAPEAIAWLDELVELALDDGLGGTLELDQQ